MLMTKTLFFLLLIVFPGSWLYAQQKKAAGESSTTTAQFKHKSKSTSAKTSPVVQSPEPVIPDNKRNHYGDGTHRQVCINPLNFNTDGTIKHGAVSLTGLQSAVSPNPNNPLAF